MIYKGPSVWKLFSGETPLVKKIQCFLWFNTENPNEEIHPDAFLREAQALVHLVRKSDQNDKSKDRRRWAMEQALKMQEWE